MKGTWILIVDDNAALAENVSEILEAQGARTEVAHDARAALAAAERRAFDVALVDVRLPDADGTDLIASLHERSPFTEVIVVTGDATLESAIAAVRGGAFAYVLKPVGSEELIDTVRRAAARTASDREREALRAQLELSERRHREVVEAAPAFVLALDEEGRIVLWNRHLEEATGMSRAEMIGAPGLPIIGAADSSDVKPLPTRGGGARAVRWRRAEVTAPGSRAERTYAIGLDVTDELEMLRRTLRAERLAAVGTLAAGLAHEVRNPLNSALLQLTVLGRRIERGELTPEALLPVVRVVKEELERLNNLVTEFLAFAQPVPLTLEPTSANDLCRAVLALVEPEAEQAGVALVSELDPAAGVLSAEPARLRQVLLNLIRNGLEAMPSGGTLTLRSRSSPGAVALEIEDTGSGFPDDAPIFDAFFTTKPHGTGLGLAIVHRIVAEHGGAIQVRSRPGCTCFSLRLPAAG